MGIIWQRIERRAADGAVRDWVEVGRCDHCGAGVDRDFPGEYAEFRGRLFCRTCVSAVPAFVRTRTADTVGAVGIAGSASGIAGSASGIAGSASGGDATGGTGGAGGVNAANGVFRRT